MFRTVLKRIRGRWRSYRRRFVPWLVLNLSKDGDTLRQVAGRSGDRLLPDGEVSRSLLGLLRVLLWSHWARHGGLRAAQTHFLRREAFEEVRGVGGPVCGDEALFQTLGFCIDRKPSSLPSAGTGVFVTKGFVPRGAVVALYPGTVYQVHEPVLLQSIRNPFVFRCIDGVLVDGKDRGLSGLVFRSCSSRDRMGPFMMSDTTWLTDRPQNPLAVGQYVNNCSRERPANVCYQEYDVPEDFPLELWQFLPNVNYRPAAGRPLRCVVLVSLRDISAGEELLSNYYTVVH